MIRHHPDMNMLVEYASGHLDWGVSLGVASHLYYCKECRDAVAKMNDLGGSLLVNIEPEAVADEALDNVMSLIDQQESDPQPKRKETVRLPKGVTLSQLEGLPPVVKRLLPHNKKLKWKRLGAGLHMARLKSGQDKYEVAFHKIEAGKKALEHDHRGIEMTIVMKGCFSDQEGVYNPGDLIVREPGEIHRPRASQDQDCLCFSICLEPVHLTGFLGKIINPLLSVKPS